MSDDEAMEDEEPLARWEALLLPDWTWEAYDRVEEDDKVYFGRVKSPNTYGRWEWGYFSHDQLEKAGAYRVDDESDDTDLFPDGGWEPLADVYATELDALQYLDPRNDEDETEGDRGE